MPDEIQANSARSSGAMRQSDRNSTRPANWISRNEKFIRAMSMIAAYVFGAIFLISLLLVGAFAFITGALAGIFVVSVAIIFALSRLRRRQL